MRTTTTYLLALSASVVRPLPSFSSVDKIGLSSMGLGSVGPEMVGRRRELEATELMLERGSVGLGRDPEPVRENHFVGLEKKLEMPDGEEERVKEGREGDDLIACGGPGCAEVAAAGTLFDVFEGCTRRMGMSTKPYVFDS